MPAGGPPPAPQAREDAASSSAVPQRPRKTAPPRSAHRKPRAQPGHRTGGPSRGVKSKSPSCRRGAVQPSSSPASSGTSGTVSTPSAPPRASSETPAAPPSRAGQPAQAPRPSALRPGAGSGGPRPPPPGGAAAGAPQRQIARSWSRTAIGHRPGQDDPAATGGRHGHHSPAAVSSGVRHRGDPVIIISRVARKSGAQQMPAPAGTPHAGGSI